MTDCLMLAFWDVHDGVVVGFTRPVPFIPISKTDAHGDSLRRRLDMNPLMDAVQTFVTVVSY